MIMVILKFIVKNYIQSLIFLQRNEINCLIYDCAKNHELTLKFGHQYNHCQEKLTKSSIPSGKKYWSV